MSENPEADTPNFWIRTDMVPILIGPGGSVIRKYRETYHCEIDTAREYQLRDKSTRSCWQKVYVDFNNGQESIHLPGLIGAVEDLIGEGNVTTVWPPQTFLERFEARAKSEGYVSKHVHKKAIAKILADEKERRDTANEAHAAETRNLNLTYHNSMEELQKKHTLEIKRLTESYEDITQSLRVRIQGLQEEIQNLKQHECQIKSKTDSSEELLEIQIALRKAHAELHAYKAQVEIEKADRDLQELRNGKRIKIDN